MKIRKRYFLILKEIIENSDDITGKELESKFHLSRKQLSYGIGKINEYLKDCGYPEITRASNGKVKVPAQIISGLNLAELEKENEEIIFSKEERIDILQLMLLTSKEELSLQHFISELKVSKNTVLADLRKLDKGLQPSRLKLSYDRQGGYTLIGSEYDKRQLLVVTLSNIIIQYGHAYIVRKICGITQTEIKETRKLLEGIAETLELRFAGEMLEANSYLFTIIARRIKEGRRLEKLPENLKSISETIEYSVVEKYMRQREDYHVNEIMYLTAHIQGMKIESVGRIRDVVNEFRLRKAVKETIDNYENLSGITFNNKDDLEELLVHHCGPALYRIRYNFHIGLDITKYVLPAYQKTHELVHRAAKPLEALTGGNGFPEKELVYLTLIIASYIMRENMKEEDLRPRAVIVCQNGITVSRVLMSLLKSLFPEIKFRKCMSVSQFTEFEEPFDMVFSTSPLETHHSIYVIDPLMNEKQQRNLREKVLKGLPARSKAVSDQKEFLKMALKYTSEDLYPQKTRRGKMSESYHLRDLLTAENIRVAKVELEWQEAIESAAMPLLYSHAIRIRYVETIINNIIENQPYLAVADGVVIAHAGVEAGVNDVGISMLVLPKRISIYDYLDAEIIIVLATPDYEKHLTALNELILILEDEDKLRKIKNAKVPEDILELI